MKRTFSIGLLATMLICSIGIGISGFRSTQTIQPYDPLPRFNHHMQTQFGIEDLGVFKYQVDLPGFSNKASCIKAENDLKPDNTNHQIIHWQQMHYYTKL